MCIRDSYKTVSGPCICVTEEMPRCCKRSWIWRNVPFQWQGLGRTGRVVKEAGNERLYFMSDKKGGQAVFCGEYQYQYLLTGGALLLSVPQSLSGGFFCYK